MGVVRKTKSVKLILEAVENSNQALSVVELVKRFENNMNKTTVYRILERLEEEKVLHSFTGQNGLKWVAKYQDYFSSEKTHIHPHFQCQNCGKSECLAINIPIPNVPDYHIDSANLILSGHCSSCMS
ncbi:MAG: transcriptional repressor [Bacteroidota bacterium]